MLLLGIADIVAALLLVRGFYEMISIPSEFIYIFAVYLFIKAIIFIFDIASIIDIAAGILLVLTLYFVVPPIVLLAFAAFLGLKGAMTLLAGAKIS